MICLFGWQIILLTYWLYKEISNVIPYVNSKHGTYEETKVSSETSLTAVSNKAGSRRYGFWFTGSAVRQTYLSLPRSLLTALFRIINYLSGNEKQTFILVFKGLIPTLQTISLLNYLLHFVAIWPALHRRSRQSRSGKVSSVVHSCTHRHKGHVCPEAWLQDWGGLSHSHHSSWRQRAIVLDQTSKT